MAENYNLKHEDHVILNCSLTNLSEDNIKNIKHLTDMDLNWDYLINMAYQHRLSPLLYWHLNNTVPDKIPSNLKVELQENFRSNVTKNLAMFRELLEVIHVLQEHGINPIPYKGPVLAIMTYKNLGFRIFGDLDFYLPLKDVPWTKEILIEEGYEPGMELSPNQERAFYKFQREYHFTNKLTSITLEIKWKFLSTLFSINNETFLEEKEFFREVDVDQFKLKTVSPKYLILILSIHNASHSFSSLYRFCDISELIKSEDRINWQQLMDIASELGMKRIFLVNLYILRELFRIELSDDILKDIKSDSQVEKISCDVIRRLFTLKPRGVVGKAVFHIKSREKTIDKLKTFYNMVFLPTPGVIESVSLPWIFGPFYYILRVIQMLKNISHP